MEQDEDHALIAAVADKWLDPDPKSQARAAVMVWFGGYAQEPVELKEQRIKILVDKFKTGLPHNTITYFVGQAERTKKGRLHLQMYAEFTGGKVRSAIRKRILGEIFEDYPMYIAKRRGSPKQASDYCKKFDTAIGNTQWEHGTPCTQGARHDLDGLMEAIKSGATTRELANDFAHEMFERPRGVAAMIENLRPKQDKIAKTCWIWGDSSTLKTSSIKRLHGINEIGKLAEVNPKPWFTYREEKVLLFNEIPYGLFAMEHRASLLEWLEMGQPDLPVKNGFIPRRADYIYATSNWDPYHVLAGTTRDAIAIRRRWNILEFRERLQETAEERSRRHPATYLVRIWRMRIHHLSGNWGPNFEFDQPADWGKGYVLDDTYVFDERDTTMTPLDSYSRDREPLLTSDDAKLEFDPVTREWIGGRVHEHANDPLSPLGEMERARQLKLRARGLGL